MSTATAKRSQSIFQSAYEARLEKAPGELIDQVVNIAALSMQVNSERDAVVVQEVFARIPEADLRRWVAENYKENRNRVRILLWLYSALVGTEVEFGVYNALANFMRDKAFADAEEFVQEQLEKVYERERAVKADEDRLKAERAELAQHSTRVLKHARFILGRRLTEQRRINRHLAARLVEYETLAMRAKALVKFLNR